MTFTATETIKRAMNGTTGRPMETLINDLRRERLDLLTQIYHTQQAGQHEGIQAAKEKIERIEMVIRDLERVKNSPSRVSPKDENNFLERLLSVQGKLLEAAAQDVTFSPALVSMGETPILGRGTINIIQGKFGVHKSRLAELFAAMILAKRRCNTDFLGFERYNFGTGYYVAYIDTERNITEELPHTIQQIREKAGYDKKEQPENFFPTSIKAVNRKERLEATKAWVEHVRKTMQERGVGNWQLFVVLDVVTDCVASFNRDNESMELFDYLGNLCDDYGATFLLVIHENPGTEKARGHLGTEGGNKSGTVMQISFEKDNNGNDTDLVKLRFIKTRRAKRPQSFYLQYSAEANGLVLADPELIKEVLNERRQKADIDLVRELIERMFLDATELPQKNLLAEIMSEFDCSRNTARDRVKDIVASGNGMVDPEGKPCKLVELSEPGKPTYYKLGGVDHDTKDKDGYEEPPF
ncbi:MAG: AAA family ATPase [Phaeodactylibacter sp.]|nr:AAA family ATPase [Phaeodactylibacter sp.]